MSNATCLWHDMDVIDGDGDDVDAVECPDCQDPMPYSGGHYACQTLECPNREWYILDDGALVEIPRRVVRNVED